MEQYLPLDIYRDGEEHSPDGFIRRCDLTENFFIYLHNTVDTLKIPIIRVNCDFFKINPYTFRATATENTDIEECHTRTCKTRKEVTEEDLQNLDFAFDSVIDLLKDRMQYAIVNGGIPIKAFYVKGAFWSHMFHPTAFSPRQGIFLNFYEYKPKETL